MSNEPSFFIAVIASVIVGLLIVFSQGRQRLDSITDCYSQKDLRRSQNIACIRYLLADKIRILDELSNEVDNKKNETI